MSYWIVTDVDGYAHFVEANTPTDAIVSVPGGEAVRTAHQRDIEAHLKQQEKAEEE